MASPTIALLHQTDVWVNGSGVHDLADMDPDHRANLIPFLRGNAETLRCTVEVQVLDLLDLGESLTLVHRAAELLDAHRDRPAEDWLVATPLMVRLVELDAGRPIEARRATHERNQRFEAETGYQKVRHG